MKRVIILDTESDGFLYGVTTIHCIAIKALDGPHMGPNGGLYVSFQEQQQAIDLINQADVIVGHNISGHDKPLLDRFYPNLIKWDGKIIIDTYLESCLLYPDNLHGHSLEAWANKLGLPQSKVQIDDWSKFTANMGTRCKTDVEINEAVYKHFNGTWVREEQQVECLEVIIAEIQAYQELHGVAYDRDGAVTLMEDMKRLQGALRDKITKGIPPRIKQGSTVARPFKKDGSLAKRANDALVGHAVERGGHPQWTKYHPPSAIGPFSKLEFVPFNLDSPQQVNKFLLDQGWKPSAWNFTTDEHGRKVKSSPKLTVESWGSLPKGLGEDIGTYKMLSHRIRMISNVRKDGSEHGHLATIRPDGRIPAEALTCATPTSRYRHMKSVCNIPRPSTPYGKDIRKLFRAGEGKYLLGIDLSQIEARMMCHYVIAYPQGQALVDRVLNGDFHQYNADNWGVSRDLAKNGLYALMYGCGEAKLASTLGAPKGTGDQFFDIFWRTNPALKLLIDDLHAAVSSGRPILGIDRRVLTIREKRMALNTLLQGGAAIVFKHWMRLCNEYIKREYPSTVHQIIAYHDELQFEVNDFINPTNLGGDLVGFAKEAGELLKVRVPITAEYKVGMNWAHTH
jgi:hypothetical protein